MDAGNRPKPQTEQAAQRHVSRSKNRIQVLKGQTTNTLIKIRLIEPNGIGDARGGAMQRRQGIEGTGAARSHFKAAYAAEWRKV